MSELVICCAPAPGEKQTEKFPGRLDQAAELIACHRAGAAIGHMHARDAELMQTVDVRLFREQVQRIRSATDMIIEGSTGGAPEHTLDQRCATFTVAEVEMGSLNLGSVNMYDGVYQNRYEDIVFYARKLREHRILPIMPVFDLSHMSNFDRLVEDAEIAPPYLLEFVFDVPAALPYRDQYLDMFVKHLPPGAQWFCVRHHQRGVSDLGRVLELGGHIRVGFEDSPFLSDGTRARNNIELVEDAVAVAQKLGRRVVGPARAREILGLRALAA
jgi:3-keto-5-aminohexanoate cleavage enzyme